jgi:hypothetical protein
MPQQNKDVFVIPKGSGCVVTPAIQTADHGNPDRITWHNLTTDTIVVFVPDGVFSASGSGTHTALPITAGSTGNLIIHGGANLGNTAYGVYCRSTNSFAVGHSDPEIIVT